MNFLLVFIFFIVFSAFAADTPTPEGAEEKAAAALESVDKGATLETAAPADAVNLEAVNSALQETPADPAAADGVATGKETKEEVELKELETAIKEGDPNDAKREKEDLVQMNPSDYRVREFDGQLELKTPWGDYVVPGEFGAKGLAHYKFAIPIDLIKPPEPEKKEEEKTEEPRDLASVPPTVIQNPPFPDKIELKLDMSQPMKVTVDDSDMLVVEANHLYNRRRYFESLTVVERILKKDPNNVRAWLMKGSLMLVQGHKDLAVKAWNNASKLDPENPEVAAVLEKYK